MPKRWATKSPKTIEGRIDIKENEKTAQTDYYPERKSFNLGTPKKTFLTISILTLLLLVGFGYLFRGKFIAAMVNGKPIFHYELGKRLLSTYGKETLENIIVEKLIREEARKKGVLVGEEEIDGEIEKIKESLGEGLKIEDALKSQGLSISEFKEQLKLKLQVNKVLEKEITVSPEEIEKYLKDNLKSLIATSDAERKIEAQQRLMEQKFSERVQTWVGELVSKAKITRFLK